MSIIKRVPAILYAKEAKKKSATARRVCIPNRIAYVLDIISRQVNEAVSEGGNSTRIMEYEFGSGKIKNKVIEIVAKEIRCKGYVFEESDSKVSFNISW